MHINKLNVETSSDVEGDIGACEYLDNNGPQRKGLFSGLFR